MCNGHIVTVDERLDADEVLAQAIRSSARRARRSRSASAVRGEVCEQHPSHIDCEDRDSENAVRVAEAMMLEALTAPAAPAAEAQGQPLATDRQVAYIMSMIEDGVHGWMTGPRDLAGVQRLTRTQASSYITTLKES